MDFYVINNNRFNDSKYAFGESIDQKTGDFEICEVCKSPISMRRWLPPFNVKLSKPSYGDFVFGTFTTFLVSEVFKQKYESADLKGILAFEPIDVVKVKRVKLLSPTPPQFYNVVVTRSKTRIDEVKSMFVRDGDVECDTCRTGGAISSFQGVYLLQETWDRYDIFFPTGLPGTIVISQRFYDFVKENKFTNIDFVPAEQYAAPWAIEK
ncbi:MAG: hypothetical protein K0R50_218 [Eubacterium sp.]|nr:hypothetical protein [Eubacterium sp.]